VTALTTIKVTAEHIANGKRGVAKGPIELALGELYPGVPADVYTNWIHLCGTEEGCLETDLPGEAEDFIRDFEDGRPVEPLEFTVRWEAAPDDEDEEGR
jgi:hypothetical protein